MTLLPIYMNLDGGNSSESTKASTDIHFILLEIGSRIPMHFLVGMTGTLESKWHSLIWQLECMSTPFYLGSAFTVPSAL